MAQQDLTGQTAIVVGASSGMGRATVKNVATSGVLLATNLSGAFHCTRAVLPAMRQANKGLIIYVSTTNS